MVGPLNHGFDETGPQYIAHQGSFYRGKSQDASYKGPHEFMGDAPGLRKDLVLQCAPLKTLEDDPLKNGLRLDDPLFPFRKFHGLASAFQCTYTAADTHGLIHHRFFLR